MTAKATIFVQLWLQENLARMPSTNRVESVEVLAKRCIHEANAAGIQEEEIEDEIGDLKSFIREAMDSGSLEQIDDEDSE
jgi:hypothetical protein